MQDIVDGAHPELVTRSLVTMSWPSLSGHHASYDPQAEAANV